MLFLVSLIVLQLDASEYFPDIKKITDRGVLRVSMYSLDTPPFFYHTPSGELKGIDIEIAGKMAQCLGVSLEITATALSFDEVISQVIFGYADLAISNLSITVERAKSVAFTRPYFNLNMALMIDHRLLNRKQDIEETPLFLNSSAVTIGILGNSSYVHFALEEFPDAAIIEFKDWNSVVSAAEKGEIMAAFYDEFAVEKAFLEKPALALKFQQYKLKGRSDRIAVAVPVEKKDFFCWVETFLDEYRRNINQNPQWQLNRYFADLQSDKSISDVTKNIQGSSPHSQHSSSVKHWFWLLIICMISGILWSMIRSLSFSFRWMLSPWTILASMTAGALYGAAYPLFSSRLEWIGDLYLTLLNMCAMPVMVTAVIAGIGRLIFSRAAGISFPRLLGLFLFTLMLASASGMTAGIIGRPGKVMNLKNRETLGGMVHHNTSTASEKASADGIYSILRRIIPSNIFAALSQGDVLGVLFFSVLLGAALGLSSSENGQKIIHSIETLFTAFLAIITWSMYLLSPALFCLMARFTSGTGASIFSAMTGFVIIYHVVCLIFIALILIYVSSATERSFPSLLFTLKEPLLVAFGTANSYASMPFAIRKLTEELHIDKRTVNVSLPLGLTVCRPGTIINLSLGTIFIAQLSGLELTGSSVLLIFTGVILSGLAAAGAPSAIEISMLSIVLIPLGVPVSVALILLLAVDPLTDPIRTMLNVTANCGITCAAARKGKNA